MLVAACSSGGSDSTNSGSTISPATDGGSIVDPATPRARFRFPSAPTAPPADTQSAAEALDHIAAIRQLIIAGQMDAVGVRGLGETGDVRHAWYLSDLLRFFRDDGVVIDDRELGDPESCSSGCIPLLDDFATTDAAGGDWYPDGRIVFGLVEGDATLAFPKNIAEIHEMFNFTLGERRFGLPYCTLCGSAQAYYTDNSGADA